MTHLELRLPDGGMLLLPAKGLAPAVRDQLETWSLVDVEDLAEATGEGPRRSDPSAWTQALAAGPLLIAAIQGVIGNAAWSVFPAAAQYLRALRVGRPALDAGGAAARARASVSDVCGVDLDDVAVDSAARESTGAWAAGARLSDGRRFAVVLDPSGTVVAVRPDVS